MNTAFYKYAIEVERVQSITQAAKNLFMAQPNLSKMIKEMEDFLGFTVFERTSKGVIPTAKGKVFLKYAHNIVLQLEKIEAIGDLDDKEIQRFNLCIPRGSYIAKAVTNFVAQLDEQKGMDVNIQETNSLQAITNIVEGRFNLGIIRYQTIYEPYFQNYMEEKQLTTEEIWTFAYKALMSKNHPLAKCEKLTKESFQHYTEIVHGDTMVPYLMTEPKAHIEESKKQSIYVYERGNQFELLTHVSTTYMWVSTIPKDMLDRYELVQRDCDYVGNVYKDVLVYPSSYRLGDLDKRFIHLLHQAKDEVEAYRY